MNSIVSGIMRFGMVVTFFALAGCTASGVSAAPVLAPPQDVATADGLSTARPGQDRLADLVQAASPIAARSCDPDAEVPGYRNSAVENPVSRAHSGADVIGDAAAAIKAARLGSDSAYLEQARSLGWEDAKATQGKAAAVRMAYEDVLTAEGAEVPKGGDAVVHPQRCVWVVTVEEPFIQQHVKPGVEARVFDSYTSVVDQATGEGISISAGPGAVNVLSGKGFLN